MATGNIGLSDQSQLGLNSGIGVKVLDTNEITLVNTTSAAAISTQGANVVTPVSMTGITLNSPLLIDNLLSGVQETIVVTAIVGGTFSANFRNTHTAGFAIVSNVERQNFSISDPTNIGQIATVSGSALNINVASALPIGANTIGNVNINGTVPVSGALSITPGGTVAVSGMIFDGSGNLNVDLKTALPTGTNGIGTVGVTSLPALVAGAATIGNVNVNGTVPISGAVSLLGTSAVSGSVAVSALPALPAGGNAIGSVIVTTLPSLPTGANTIGSVNVLNTIPISGSINVANFPASQNVVVTNTAAVSGTVILGTGAAAIGTVGVTALPALPTGANAIGTVGVTALPALPTGANTIGNVNINGTVPVSGTLVIAATDTVAVSGSVSVISLPSIPTGANAIGSVSLNTALPSGANTIGNVKLVDAAGVNQGVITPSGQQITKEFAASTSDWQATTGATPITAANGKVTQAAAGVGVRNYLTCLQFQSTNSIASQVQILDGATVIWAAQIPAFPMGTVSSIAFQTPLKGTANTAMSFNVVSGSTNTAANIQGYTGA